MLNVAVISNRNIYADILTFLRNKGLSSSNTRKRFEFDIRQFFRFIRNKDIEQLTLEDLYVKNSEAMEYQNFLSQKYKNTVVNSKFIPLRSLYKYLEINNYPVSYKTLIVPELPDDTKPIGYLTPDEVFLLADLALEETHQAKLKHALILTAFATGMRLGALLKIKFKHIRINELNPDEYLIETDYFDKGKKVIKEIHKNWFQKILEAKSEFHEEDFVFDIKERTVRLMMERLCQKAGFDTRRKITFHSIRKAGADFVHDYTNGDIQAVANYGNWSNINTPYQRYMKRQVNIAGLVMFEDIGNNVFDELTKEEAIYLLKSISNKSGTGVRLRREAMKIIQNRKEGE